MSGSSSCSRRQTRSARIRTELMFQVISRTMSPLRVKQERASNHAGMEGTTNRAETKRRPVGGGGPGACLSEALGGNRARRGDGTGIRGHDALSASKEEDGGGGAMMKMQITHALPAKTHARTRNLWKVNIKRRGGLTQIPLWLHGRLA